MAESLLFNIASNIIQTLTPIIVGGIIWSWRVKDELGRLMNNIGIIKGVLLDAEQRQHSSQAVKEWVKMVRDVIYDVDDMVELISTDTKRQELVAIKHKWSHKVRKYFSQSNPLILNHSLAKNVKDLKARLDVIISTMATFNFLVRDADENMVAYRSRNEQTCGFIDTEEILGRDGDKKRIMEMLMDGEESLSVIPIVGIGGLGKTALAQLIYNDKVVNQHFKVKMWVSVSEDFDVHSIVKKIVRCIDRKVAVDKLSLDELLCHVQQNLRRKRYLLFLDDIWNENREKWLRLKSVLPPCGYGSRVLITTRYKIVADIMGTVPSYELKGLSEEQSWSLFTRVAFKPGQAEGISDFTDLGRQIVKKCANVPLAIRTLGSLLYGKDTVREWMLIKDEELSKIEQDENHILPVLKVSYMHLTSHLKHCFALCALFPKDCVLRKERLINLWIAAGFVQRSNKTCSLEDIGEDYFMLLLRRCFFQNAIMYNSGAVRSCMMHDLIHDLALSVAKEDALCLQANATGRLCDGIRYASASSRYPQLWVESKQLRVLLFPTNRSSSSFFSRDLKVLRMLDLSHLRLKSVPSVIGDMKLLRYLYLRGNSFRKLPNSLTGLLNLQLLDLESCDKLEKLPRNFEKLINLRFLNISMTYMSSCEWNKIPFYGDLSHFKVTDANSVILSGKPVEGTKLQLVMDCQMLFYYNIKATNLEVLEVKNLCGDLILKIFSAPGTLINLVEVRIEDCLCLDLPSLSLLPSLKCLVLQHLNRLLSIRNINTASSYSEVTSVSPFFPSLVELELHDLPCFQGWEPLGDAQYHHPKPSFPPLSKLRISNCPMLTALPQVTQVKELQIDDVNETILQMFRNEIINTAITISAHGGLKRSISNGW